MPSRNPRHHYHPTSLTCNPETLHILRTSPVFSSPLLVSWDELLLSVWVRITNIDLRLGDPSRLQASLPASSGGLGLRNASHLAPSAFLASADGASTLVQKLLPQHLPSSPYTDKETALSTWKRGLPEDTPLPPCSLRGRQKSWDQPSVEQLYLSLLSNDISRARLLAAASKHSGAWLNAPPVSSHGLRISNETIHIPVGLRVGAAICHPHNRGFCGKEVDQLGHHGLSCRYSQGHLIRHNALNSVSMAVAHAEGEKAGKYSSLDHAYSFQRIAIETSGSVGLSAMSFLRVLGHHLKTTTGEPQSLAFLLQRLSVANQTGYAISVLGSLGSTC